MYKLESLPDDYCDESEAEMTEQEEPSEEDDHSMLGEAEEEYMSEGDEFISPQMRDFVVPHAEDECWGTTIYKPPDELAHLVSKAEKVQVLKEAADREYNRSPPKKSSFQRNAQKRTRATRRALAREARNWQTKLESCPPKPTGGDCQPSATTNSNRSCRVEKPFQKKKQKKQSRILDSWKVSKLGAAVRRANPFKSLMSVRPSEFTTIREDTISSHRSVGSEVKRKKILDAIQWDSD